MSQVPFSYIAQSSSTMAAHHDGSLATSLSELGSTALTACNSSQSTHTTRARHRRSQDVVNHAKP
jgi:hypothetical protein